jgi:ArsR family transcriptional regulator, arsenate/arsenite/antimonite-responsive transcriptional repressor
MAIDTTSIADISMNVDTMTALPAETCLPETGTMTVAPVACCPPVLTSPLSTGDADQLSALFRLLSDPVRLRLLSLIANAPGGEACVCELVEPLARTQPTVSHHLAALTEAGLLHREQRGRWAYYRVDTDRIAQLRNALTLP